MGKKSKTPKAPDYSNLAVEQAGLNKKSWLTGVNAGRPNQTNPMGSVDWTIDPETGESTQNTTWNPVQEMIFNQQQGNQQTIADKSGAMLGGLDTSQIDFGGAPAMPTVGGYNQQATDLYNQLAAPELNQRANADRARRTAMGLGEASGQAWDSGERNLNDAFSRSGMMGAQAGINQGNTMFNQGMQARQQGVSDILNQRTGNLAQVSGLMGLGQNLTTPQFAGVGNVGQPGAANLMGAANSQYGAALNDTNAANADKSNTMQGIGTAASIAASAF